MTCPVTDNNAEIFLDYCTRRLDWDAVETLERHMAVCPECNQMAESQKLVWAALDSWEAAPISADFDERLHSRIERAGRTWWDRLRDFASYRPAWGVAAAMCATLLCVVLVRQPAELVPSAGDTIEVAEVEQAEGLAQDMDMLNQLGVVALAERPAESGEDAKSL